MNKGLFGTDGIRGVANQHPITPEVALDVGRAVVLVLGKNAGPVRVVIGWDTRISCDMIASALCSGICASGGEAFLAGVMPTPGIAYVTLSEGFDAGVMISASHNPYQDNGIKIFNAKGFKLSDELEQQIEDLVLGAGSDLKNQKGYETIGRVRRIDALEGKYEAFLRQTLADGNLLRGLRVVLDCANGATYRVAPHIFSDLGADVHTLFASPNGKNINDQCGSQHTQTLAKTVLEKKADIGLAFDGDGDRLIAVDERGKTVTGDQMLAVIAGHLKSENRLANNLVVSTVMSNLGLHQTLLKMGIDHIITDVGDRNVLEQMLRKKAVLGGEDSGHMIFLEHHTSGDGILTALQLIQVIRATSKPLSQLAGIMPIYPQVLINVRVGQKKDICKIPEISHKISDIQNRLGKEGRVLVRYSGTQPLCRVMVEGPDAGETRRFCQEIADLVQNKLGG